MITAGQESYVVSLVALARLEGQVRILRAVADVLESNGADELLYVSLRNAVAAIEQSANEIDARLKRPVGTAPPR